MTRDKSARRVSIFVCLGISAWASMAQAAQVPPEPTVLAPNGTSKLTLEQAGILRTNSVNGKTARQWAVILGKALFWDIQAGSNGMACGSCHFHAGADTRLTNQINPGFNDLTAGPGGDTTFGSRRSDTGQVLFGRMPSGAIADSNYTIVPADLPLHRLSDERDRNSPIVTTTNDRISSLGSFDADFLKILNNGAADGCGPSDASPFHAGSFAARQVEPRNTPTVINSAFFHRNFWDGRANNMFNGVGVFGMRDIAGNPDARLIVLDQLGKPQLGYVQIDDASLASQAVGPPLSGLEMSCTGRKFADIARKILEDPALFFQTVSPADSVLGPLANNFPLGKGLAPQYRYSALIKNAFDSKYWTASGKYRIAGGKLVADPTGFTQIETNFSLFWGVAIMLYERTLVSDQSQLDDLLATGKLVMKPAFVPAGPAIGGCSAPTGGVDPLILRGCTIFSRFAPAGALAPPPPDGIRGGNCFVCHNAPGGGVGQPIPPLLSQAASRNGETFALMIEVGKQIAGVHRHDQGLMSIGLRPVFTDLLSGGFDPYGHPLSFTRQYQRYLLGGNDRSQVHDPVLLRAIDSGALTGPLAAAAPTLGVDGAAKAPILRNVALTPPYFSWGGYPSLRQALKLYNRGGNRRDISATDGFANRNAGTVCTSGDDTGTGADGNQPHPLTGITACDTNTTGVITPLGLLDCDPDPLTGLPPAACTAAGKNSTNDDLAALAAFMKAMTDVRVQCAKAPFDRPEIQLVLGHKTTDGNGDGKADDILFVLPAVGAAGYAPASGLCIPNAGDLFAPGMQTTSGGVGVPLAP
jgi:cytochrome c peroxidase